MNISSQPNVRALFAAAHACGLHLRNWSGGGEVVFAVYEAAADSYLGTVLLAGPNLRAHGGPWYKRDHKRFNSLVSAFETAFGAAEVSS